MGLSNENYITFQLLISVSLTFIAYNRFFKENRALLFLGLFFMINSSSFYLIHGNVIRQGLASSLILLSVCPRTKSSTIYYKILAFFSHKGSLFSFLSEWLIFNRKKRLIILLAALILGYFSVFIHILNLLPLPGFILTKISFYSTFERASSNSIIKLLLLVCFNLIFIFYRNRTVKYEKVFNVFFIFSIAAMLLFKFDVCFRDLYCTQIFLFLFYLLESYRILRKRMIN